MADASPSPVPATSLGDSPRPEVESAGWPAPTWGRLAVFAGLSRVVVVLAGIALAPVEPDPHWTPEQVAFRADIRNGPVPWAEPWYRFDAGWYYRIAREGYRGNTDGPAPAAFLPLLPVCIAAVAELGVNPILAGLAIPNLAFIAGLACAGRAGLRVTRNHRTVWWGCIVLVGYPFAYVFSAPYQESLFLAAGGAALLAWYDRRPVAAGAAALVAATARLTAVALPVGLLLEYVATWRSGRPRHGVWWVVGGTAAGIALFCGYLALTLGDPLAHFHAHAAWGRESPGLGGVARSMTATVHELIHPSPPFAVVKPLVLIAVVALGVRGWFRRGPLWGTLILLPVAQAMATGTLLSIERIVLSAWPAAFEAADLPGAKYLLPAWVVAAVPAQLFFLWMFIHNGFLN